MKTEETTKEEHVGKFVKAGMLFNKLTGASYYGMNFRQILATDPEAMAAAEKLVERLAAKECEGL